MLESRGKNLLIQVILCHPRPGSFNHAVAERVLQALKSLGHAALFHDLYKEGFDPVLPAAELRRGTSFDETVLRHTGEIEAAEALVIVHPDWWSQPPALLKGWIDRVLRPGVAYEFEGPEFMKKDRKALLAGKKALVFCTTDRGQEEGPQDSGRLAGGPSLLEELWLEGVFRYCGIEEAACHILYDLRNLDRRRRLEWLVLVERTLTEWFPVG